jgi:3-methylcrotonyl-CoA carboxylase alpha subunit
MDEATRAAVCGAAVKAAQAVNYEGAGTIEFIADVSEGLRADRVWFMEMNTRLQVEHPVTEEITGEDLVEWQLRVASGEPCPKKQDELAIDGWAIEARLYAEDPGSGFLPSVGRLEHFDLGEAGPDNVSVYGEPRIETGVEEGDAISSFYDPMIAKVIGWGTDRNEAIEVLAGALADAEVWPVRTNAAFLVNALEDEDFAEERIDTGFIGRKLESLVPAVEPDDCVWRGAASVALAIDEEEAETALQGLAGFRLNAAPAVRVALGHRGRGRVIDLGDEGAVAALSGFRDGERVVVFDAGQAFEFSLSVRGIAGAAAGDGAIIAPMPGKVTSVDVSAGERVGKGQRLLTLEAMKMEHGLVAPFDGVVAELNAVAGGQVQVDAVLARIEKAEA